MERDDIVDEVHRARYKSLDENLTESYKRILFRQTCGNVFEMMPGYASHGRKWVA